MKKLAFSAIALLVLAGSSLNAATLTATQFAGKEKPKTTTTEPAPGPSGSVVPGCPPSDPNGCGILD